MRFHLLTTQFFLNLLIRGNEMARITLCTSNCTLTNTSTEVEENSFYTNVLVPSSGYVFDLDKVVVQMGGEDIYVVATPNRITIGTAVIGNIYIVAQAVKANMEVDMSYLSPGTHTITADCFAAGYIDSPKSDGVTIDIEG